MRILDYFKRKGIDKRNYDLVVTSDKPYQTGVTDKDGIICHKTFTPPLNMVAGEEYHLPVKVSFDKRNLYSLELYLPDASTVEMLKSLPENTTVMISLWLFLDDGSFFIIFPDEVNPYFDENRMITFYRISFSRAGFHSERKNLKDVFTSEEICNFLREELTTHDIVEIQPRILGTTDDGVDCRSIEISSPTAEYIARAIESIHNSGI